MATVTSLTGIHRGGQTFLTFTKQAGWAASTVYSVYRSPSQITSLSGLSVYCTVRGDTYKFLCDDTGAGGANVPLNNGFKIPASSAEAQDTTATVTLASTQALAVITTGVAETGSWYYAVTHAGDASVSVGNNSLTNAVAETYQAIPGIVFTSDWIAVSSDDVREFVQFSDITTWGHGSWGCYCNKYLVQRRSGMPSGATTYPVIAQLHSAAEPAYMEPAGQSVTLTDYGTTVYVFIPVEISPKTAGTIPARCAPAQGIYFDKSSAEAGQTGFSSHTLVGDATHATFAVGRRMMQALQALRDHAALQIDPNRVYMSGGSFGGVGMHVAYQPEFAGILAGINAGSGITSMRRFTGCSGSYDAGNYSPEPLLEDGRKQWSEAWNVNYTAAHATVDLAPVTYRWGDTDTHPQCTFREATDATLAAKQAYWAECVSGGHVSGMVFMGADSLPLFLRFKRNEAYPAISACTLNDTFIDTTPGDVGQHNLLIDWHCSLHSIAGGAAITDTPTAFGISLLALETPATITLTIRNAQSFRPGVGATLPWTATGGQFGTATRNADGSVTVELVVQTSATRLEVAAITPHFIVVRS